MSTGTITVHAARWLTSYHAFEQGTSGSTYQHAYVLFELNNDFQYLWWSHSDGTQQAHPDPGSWVEELDGLTGVEVQLPAGLSTPEQHADLVAVALMEFSFITSASVAIASNSDGTWDVNFSGEFVAVTPGGIDWLSRGAAGLHGGHGTRPGVAADGITSTSTNVTRPLASRISTPPAGAIVSFVQLLIGATAGTGTAARIRIGLYANGSSSTTPGAGTAATLIHDFGQIAVAQTVVNSVATIWLTAAESAACTAAIAAATGNFWLVIKAVTGCHYVAFPNGTAADGEQANNQLQVDVSTMSNDPTAAFAATWNGASTVGVSFTIGARLGYAVLPCTSGEHYSDWGSPFNLNYADYPSSVALPDSHTYQTGDSTEHVGAQLHTITNGIVSGSARIGVFAGGTVSPLASASPVNATLLWDAGLNATTGGNTVWTAPTGAGSIHVPSGGIHVAFKGTAAVGRGEVGPAPFVTSSPIRPSDWMSDRTTGAAQAETDLTGGAGFGTASTVWPSPVSGPITRPGNHPFIRIRMRQPGLAVAYVFSSDTEPFAVWSFEGDALNGWVLTDWSLR